MKSERWTAPAASALNFFANADSANHGKLGAIRTGSYTFYHDVVLPFFKTLNNLGLPTNLASVLSSMLRTDAGLPLMFRTAAIPSVSGLSPAPLMLPTRRGASQPRCV